MMNKGDLVRVSHVLKHRDARNGHLFYCPLQRVPTGWIGSYRCAIGPVNVYDAITDTAARCEAHIIAGPTGDLHRAITADITQESTVERIFQLGDLVSLKRDLKNANRSDESLPAGTSGIVRGIGSSFVKIEVGEGKHIHVRPADLISVNLAEAAPFRPVEEWWDQWATAAREKHDAEKNGANLAVRASDGS